MFFLTCWEYYCSMDEELEMETYLHGSEATQLPNLVEVLIDGKMTLLTVDAFEKYMMEEAEKSYEEWKKDGFSGEPVAQVFAELRKKHGLPRV